MTHPLHILADRVEGLSGPSRVIDGAIWSAVARPLAGDPDTDLRVFDAIVVKLADGGDDSEVPAYTDSLDAAMSLVPEGWAIDCLKEGEPGHWYVNMRPRDWVSEWQHSKAATSALALTAASLRTIAANQENGL